VNIQSFDTGRKFSSWIYRIAHNELVNALKKKNIGRTISVFDLDVFFPHLASKERAEKEAEKKELRRMLDESLNKLNPKYREPLILYYFEEMDYRQIADILNVPVSTVGVRLSRGREALKKIIGEKNK
jgi:RNA polymerase sigma-70 factor (ECF subfamily)